MSLEKVILDMQNIILCSHDAGGAELLSLWANKNVCNSYAILDGPARSIFQKNHPNCKLISLDELADYPFPLVTSTSWQSDLEKKAIRKARSHKKQCFSLLDHWVNYNERFVLGTTLYLPDEIWVVDEHAFTLAEKTFPDTRIRLVENYYLNFIKPIGLGTQNPVSLGEAKSALYICEPVDQHSMHSTGSEMSLSNYTEKSAFQFFIENIRILSPNLQHITVRPHPAHLMDLLWAHDCADSFRIEISKPCELRQQIISHDIIIGMESMALVVSLYMEKITISAIPTGGKKCSLPFDNLIHLSSMLHL